MTGVQTCALPISALDYALSLSPDVTAVHVSIDQAEGDKVRAKWERWGNGVRLVILESPYRLMMEPLLGYVEHIAKLRQPGEIWRGKRIQTSLQLRFCGFIFGLPDHGGRTVQVVDGNRMVQLDGSANGRAQEKPRKSAVVKGDYLIILSHRGGLSCRPEYALPAAGKSHLAAALGQTLIENGYRVLFTRTTDMVQRLQAARRDLTLASVMDKLDKYDLLILDDLSYVRKDQAETSVLFELISARYERRSLLITANQPFGSWDEIFPDKAMTVAAIDRLVHHAVILEMNTDSYRRKAAVSRMEEQAAEKTVTEKREDRKPNRRARDN